MTRRYKKTPAGVTSGSPSCSASGIRTRVSAVRGQRLRRYGDSYRLWITQLQNHAQNESYNNLIYIMSNSFGQKTGEKVFKRIISRDVADNPKTPEPRVRRLTNQIVHALPRRGTQMQIVKKKSLLTHDVLILWY